jgi:putative oxidoreductase
MNMVGRILYGLPLLVFGLLHFVGAQMMAGMVPAFVPGGILWVYITGVALILAAVAIMANRLAALASLLLGIMLLGFALTIHLPMLMGGDQNAMPNLLKDTALAGAAFYIYATTSQAGKGLFAM